MAAHQWQEFIRTTGQHRSCFRHTECRRHHLVTMSGCGFGEAAARAAKRFQGIMTMPGESTLDGYGCVRGDLYAALCKLLQQLSNRLGRDGCGDCGKAEGNNDGLYDGSIWFHEFFLSYET
jgi:hypothetical protein